MNVEYYGNNALVSVDDVAYTFETAEKPREFEKHRVPKTTLDWDQLNYQVDEYRVYPMGANNDLPEVIRDVVANNSIAPGILTKKAQLVWGRGPKLYKEVIEGGIIVKQWQDDKEIQDWLDSWEYQDYLQKVLVDYGHIEGHFTKFHRSKGARVQQPNIGKLTHISPKYARLANHNSDEYDEAPKYCIVTDWSFRRASSLNNYKVYGLFNFQNPFQYSNSILYSNKYSFCSDYYTIPDIYGSLEWIRRSSAIPLILKALSKNSINLKYHVISPEEFWVKKREELQAAADKEGKVYEEKTLIEYKTNFLRQIGKVLSGEDNTGKFWHSVKYMTIEGHKIFENGWEIKEIKQNIKDFVAAQLQIAEQANRAVAAGVGVHPALGGAGESGRADSGSEQLNALKNYLVTGIDIPEMIICKAINHALKINWPDKGLCLGFYHVEPQREEEIPPSDRLTNKV